MKRLSSVWAKRYKRRWIIWKPNLEEKMRLSDYVELGGVVVPTKKLRAALDIIPSQDVLVSFNGGLDLEEIRRYFLPNPDYPGTRYCVHRLVKDGVTMTVKPTSKTEGVGVIVKLKLKPFGNNKRRKKN